MFKAREDNVRRTDEIISRVIALWPIWALMAGGTVTGISFYNKVNDLIADQKAWKATVDDRQRKSSEEKESIRTRLTRLETDVEWLKKR